MTNYVISYYPSVLLLFAIASFGAAVSVAPFLLSTKNELHQLSETLKIVIPHLGAILSSLILPHWLWFICRKNKWECSGHISYPQVTGLRSMVESDNDDISISVLSGEESPLLRVHHIQKPPSSIPVILFGSGSILYTISGMVLDLVLESQQEREFDFATVFSYIGDSGYLICLVIQIKFFTIYSGATLKNCAVYHFSIAVMVACQIWLWITSAASPLFHITSNSTSVDPTDRCLHSSNITNATEMSSSSQESIKLIYYFLEPFSVEYLTITSGYLFHLWQSMDGKTDTTNIASRSRISSLPAICADETPQSPSESDIQGCTRAREAIAEQSLRCSNSRKIRNVLFGISTVVAIFYFVIVIVESGTFIECKHEICYQAYFATTVLAYLPQVLCFYLVVQIHKTYDPIRESLSMNDILLLFTSSCKYIFFMLQFIALIGASLQTSYIHANGVSVYVKFLYPFLAFIQLSLQTHFLISVSAIQNSGKKLSTPIQAMTFFIGSLSVALWWLIAIQRAATEETTNIFCEFFLSFGQKQRSSFSSCCFLSVDCTIFILLWLPLKLSPGSSEYKLIKAKVHKGVHFNPTFRFSRLLLKRVNIFRLLI